MATARSIQLMLLLSSDSSWVRQPGSRMWENTSSFLRAATTPELLVTRPAKITTRWFSAMSLLLLWSDTFLRGLGFTGGNRENGEERVLKEPDLTEFEPASTLRDFARFVRRKSTEEKRVLQLLLPRYLL